MTKQFRSGWRMEGERRPSKGHYKGAFSVGQHHGPYVKEPRSSVVNFQPAVTWGQAAAVT